MNTHPEPVIQELFREQFPLLLREMPDPPAKLFIRGMLPPKEYKYLCIVGSRKFTDYGKAVCQYLIEGLRGYPIAIVSGLAYGIDSLAHTFAIESGLPTIAFPGSGLHDSVLYPKPHLGLAHTIVESGGALVSEFEPTFVATPWSFPQRNRLMAGISHATLIIEAEERSGTLITANFALQYNREVFTVPGSIFSSHSAGSQYLIKQGALSIRTPEDILYALRFEIEKNQPPLFETLKMSPEEKELVRILTSPMSRSELMKKSSLTISKANIAITQLEIKGAIDEVNGELFLVTK